MLLREAETIGTIAMADPEIDVVALTKAYFAVWNSHDEAALRALHADKSTLHDWDATHGPTNAAVAAGVAGIWKAEPAIKIENTYPDRHAIAGTLGSVDAGAART